MTSAPRIDPVNCSVARALSVIGERWSLLIVREALDGARRFSEFRDRLGIASNLLSARLDSLVEADVLEKIPYREPGARQRYEYRLTPRGSDLRPTLIALLEWGDKYLADPQGPSVVVRHQTESGEECQEPVRIVLECAGGHTHLPPSAIRRTPGPGAHFVNRPDLG
ncbi:winged helix-turn-helix transcriptional regulator [Nocardia beijingensis]|uniref:winged helix-turn-helix transcriptional regulator n=1 Tax=Nocardia beijingensis TaxID=95162 RepID=UPI001894BB98|nr:helix-turn-helix domain-containing protein [Nocardia beijingensis]MBF6077149.1 helix-turn-helix transcriptional regulator [Nocardia beijingensis]